MFQMFRTPSFGEDNYDFILDKPENLSFTDELIKDSKIANSQYLPTISNTDISEFLELHPRNHEYSPSDISTEVCSSSSTLVTSVYSQSFPTPVVHQVHPQPRKFLQPQQRTPPAQNTLLSRMMSVPRDSILESLGNLAPKFPPQDVDLPDINVTNAAQTTVPVTAGFSTAQMYGQTSLTSMAQITSSTGNRETTPDGSHGTAGSPTGSSMSNVSNATPPPESSEDSDDSVPLAQVCNKQYNPYQEI